MIRLIDTDEYVVPRWLFSELDSYYKFTIDAFASHENHLLPRYWTKEEDCLKQDWTNEVVWANPPCSPPSIPKIIPKLAEFRALIVVAILPAETNSEWFHKYVWDKSTGAWRPGVEVAFPDKPVVFYDPVDNRTTLRYNSIIVEWNKRILARLTRLPSEGVRISG